jgi:hypothetical protein
LIGFALAAVVAVGVYFGLLRADKAGRPAAGRPASGGSVATARSGIVKGTFGMGLIAGNGSGSETVSFRGPFTTRSSNGLPEFDLHFRIREGEARSVRFSLISTADAGFLVFRGRAYQVDPAVFERLSSASVLSEIDPGQWLSTSEAKGSKPSQRKTIRRAGRLNVDRMVSDMSRAVRSLGIRPGKIAFPASFFDRAAIQLATTQSGVLRRLALTLTWHGRSEDTQSFKAAMHTRLRIAELNRPQRIEAPADAAPLTAGLTRRLPFQLWGIVEFLSAP